MNIIPFEFWFFFLKENKFCGEVDVYRFSKYCQWYSRGLITVSKKRPWNHTFFEISCSIKYRKDTVMKLLRVPKVSRH